MDMNFNISTQFTNCFNKNTGSAELSDSKNEFTNFFKGLETQIKDIQLDIDTDKAKKEIDYDLLQNILSSLQVFIQSDNIDKFETLIGGDYSDLFEGFTNLDLKSLIDIMKNNEESKVSLNNLFEKTLKDKNLDSNSISDLKSELSDKIKEILSSKDNSDLEYRSHLSKTDKLELDNSRLKKLESFGEVGSSKNEDGSQQLELGTIANRGNILKSEDINQGDKELDTLEGIVDRKDNHNFIIPNNTVSNNTSISSDGLLEKIPVKEIRQEFIGDDIVKTVKYLKSNGIEEIKIKISPRELGDMTIKLIKNPEETKLSITISKEDVFNLVNKNIGEITKHLNDLNINVKQVSVDIKGDSKNAFSDNLNQEFNRKNQQNEKRKNKYRTLEFEGIEEVKEAKEDSLNILI